MTNRRHALIGLVSLLAAAVAGVYIIGGVTGRVASGLPVSLTFDRVGQLLRVTGDVKMRGVLVGQISKIEHLADGTARISLALDPKHEIASDVSASIRGKTLFGEKYVELIAPDRPGSPPLRAGDHIPIDRTVPPFELEQVLQSLLPVLDAAEPGDLGGALHALAQGLAGQEEELGRALDNARVFLSSTAGKTEDLDRLLAGFDEGSDAFARAAPDLVAAADELDLLNRALLASEDDVRSVLSDAPGMLDILSAIVEDRFADLVDLSIKGADILDLVASHRTSLPGAVEALKTFTQSWVTNMSTPCEDATGLTVGEKHPELADSTCWQIWILRGEKFKNPGAYGAEGPKPSSAATSAAYRAQLRHLLAIPFGNEASDLAVLLHRAVRDSRGLIPEELL
jgi:phospholipid/cholesterol/gamma-HCH transport system substrate-binding protein